MACAHGGAGRQDQPGGIAGRIAPPPAPAAELQAALREGDGLTQSLGPETPAQLRHFLQRRSYVKALEYLQSG